jgi:hypothetical protein
MAGGPDLLVELINCRPSSIVQKNCTHDGNSRNCKHHKLFLAAADIDKCVEELAKHNLKISAGTYVAWEKEQARDPHEGYRCERGPASERSSIMPAE